MANSKSYVYVIERAEDGMYWGYLPDLPGGAASAEGHEAVQEQLSEAVDLYPSYYRERGLSNPPAEARTGTLTAG